MFEQNKIETFKKHLSEKGIFFTPLEVGELMAKIIKTRLSPKTIYDPTCGSGVLLWQAANIANPTATISGQDIVAESVELAKDNLRDFKCDLGVGDVLTAPIHDDKFEAIVANPPFSIKWEQPILDPRFLGLKLPKSRADFAFIFHILSRLADNGLAVVIVFPGILYRGQSEAKARKEILPYVEAVVSLPVNIFADTQISCSLLILSKRACQSVYFLDASGEFDAGKKNKLKNIDKIVSQINKRETSPKSSIVAKSIIIENECLLSISSYLKPEPEPEIDIKKLNAEVKIRNRNGAKALKKWDILIAGMENGDDIETIHKKHAHIDIIFDEAWEKINAD